MNNTARETAEAIIGILQDPSIFNQETGERNPAYSVIVAAVPTREIRNVRAMDSQLASVFHRLVVDGSEPFAEDRINASFITAALGALFIERAYEIMEAEETAEVMEGEQVRQAG